MSATAGPRHRDIIADSTRFIFEVTEDREAGDEIVHHHVGATGVVPAPGVLDARKLGDDNAPPGLLKPQLLLELQRTHRRHGSEVRLEPGHAHAQLSRGGPAGAPVSKRYTISRITSGASTRYSGRPQ